jgi:hypothetical protein
MSIIMDDEFEETKTVSPDSRGRVALGAAGTARHYSVSKNHHGQILLTPVVQVPEYEAWLWKDPEALASVRRGLADAAAGRVHDMGSFADFADLPIDDE